MEIVDSLIGSKTNQRWSCSNASVYKNGPKRLLTRRKKNGLDFEKWDTGVDEVCEDTFGRTSRQMLDAFIKARKSGKEPKRRSRRQVVSTRETNQKIRPRKLKRQFTTSSSYSVKKPIQLRNSKSHLDTLSEEESLTPDEEDLKDKELLTDLEKEDEHSEPSTESFSVSQEPNEETNQTEEPISSRSESAPIEQARQPTYQPRQVPEQNANHNVKAINQVAHQQFMAETFYADPRFHQTHQWHYCCRSQFHQVNERNSDVFFRTHSNQSPARRRPVDTRRKPTFPAQTRTHQLQVRGPSQVPVTDGPYLSSMRPRAVSFASNPYQMHTQALVRRPRSLEGRMIARNRMVRKQPDSKTRSPASKGAEQNATAMFMIMLSILVFAILFCKVLDERGDHFIQASSSFSDRFDKVTAGPRQHSNEPLIATTNAAPPLTTSSGGLAMDWHSWQSNHEVLP